MTADALLPSWPMTTPEVLAIRSGVKTEHRIVMRPQPPARFMTGDVAGITDGRRWTISKVNLMTKQTDCWHPTGPGVLPPFQAPALYVCEEYAKLDGAFVYRADRAQAKTPAEAEINDQLFPFDLKWKPAAHMPRAAARLIIDITRVGLEQLRCVRDSHAIAEGVSLVGAGAQGQAVERYEREFQARHDTPFDPSLWVWVYQFELLTPKVAIEPGETLAAS